MGVMVNEQMAAWQFAKAQQTWTDQLDLIDSQSDGVVSICLTIISVATLHIWNTNAWKYSSEWQINV